MAKLSAQERDALMRLIRAEINQKEDQKKEELKATIVLTQEEETLVKLYGETKDAFKIYNELKEKFHALEREYKVDIWTNNYDDSIEKFRETFIERKAGKIAYANNSHKILTEIHDNLIVQGISKDFNVEQWLTEMKTKYSI